VETLAAQLIGASDELSTFELEGADVLQPADLVVAPGEHLQQGLQPEAVDSDALGQQPDQRLGARRQGLDPLCVVDCTLVLVEVLKLFADS